MTNPATELEVESQLKALVSTFTDAREEASEALELIALRVRAPRASLSLRLLAMRRYLRMGEERVVAQWAWTAEQTILQKASGPAKAMYALAERTQEIFAQSNPGYELSISPLRSLQRQVDLWVVNSSVQSAGEQLLRDIQAALGADKFRGTPSVETTRRFRSLLKNARVRPEPTSAAPGTSDHGQGTAVDFVVVRDKRTIAGTQTGQIRSRWKADGWEQRLIAAIELCNQEQFRKSVRPVPQLSGPLKNPYEPWHWVLKYAGPNT